MCARTLTQHANARTSARREYTTFFEHAYRYFKYNIIFMHEWNESYVTVCVFLRVCSAVRSHTRTHQHKCNTALHRHINRDNPRFSTVLHTCIYVCMNACIPSSSRKTFPSDTNRVCCNYERGHDTHVHPRVIVWQSQVRNKMSKI